MYDKLTLPSNFVDVDTGWINILFNIGISFAVLITVFFSFCQLTSRVILVCISTLVGAVRWAVMEACCWLYSTFLLQLMVNCFYLFNQFIDYPDNFILVDRLYEWYCHYDSGDSGTAIMIVVLPLYTASLYEWYCHYTVRVCSADYFKCYAVNNFYILRLYFR